MSFFNEIDAVWDAYLAQLETYIRQDAVEPLQPFSVSHSLPVDFVKYPKFSRGICNREVDLVTEWGATYGIPNRESLLEERYTSFLYALSKIINFHHMTDAEKQQQDEFKRSIDDARFDQANFENLVEARWANYKALRHIPSDEHEPLLREGWERRFHYYEQRALNEQATGKAASELWTFVASMTSPEEVAYGNAIAYLTADQGEAFPPNTNYEHEADDKLLIWGKHKAQTISANWDDFFARDDERHLSIDETERRSSTRSDSWNGSGGYSCGFVSIDLGGSGSSEETHFREHIKKIEISFSRLEEYDIIRGPWFQQVLFKTYGKQLNGWWGPRGLLPCYPLTVVLARGLTIKLTIDDVEHDTFKRHVDGSLGVSVGPWHIGGGGGSDSSLDEYHEEHDTFTVKDHPGLTRVVAVRVARPNFVTIPPDKFATFLEQKFSQKAP